MGLLVCSLARQALRLVVDREIVPARWRWRIRHSLGCPNGTTLRTELSGSEQRRTFPDEPQREILATD